MAGSNVEQVVVADYTTYARAADGNNMIVHIIHSTNIPGSCCTPRLGLTEHVHIPYQHVAVTWRMLLLSTARCYDLN